MNTKKEETKVKKWKTRRNQIWEHKDQKPWPLKGTDTATQTETETATSRGTAIPIETGTATQIGTVIGAPYEGPFGSIVTPHTPTTVTTTLSRSVRSLRTAVGQLLHLSLVTWACVA